MTRDLIIGLVAEGKTDYRFLAPVIERTFLELAYECFGGIEVYPVQKIPLVSGAFVEAAKSAAARAHQEHGVTILCLHKDADKLSDKDVFYRAINPALHAIKQSNEEELCRSVVPVVPVYETEAWMLADLDLFKKEIGAAQMTASELGLTQKPERISRPKESIESALTHINSNLNTGRARRHFQTTISDLYQPIGQQVDLDLLKQLVSFQKFHDAAKTALTSLGWMPG